jgi:hypothetical protein
MSYYYFVGGILSIVVLLPVGIVAWRLVNRRARAEVAHLAPRILLIAFGSLIAGAFAWAPLVNTAADVSIGSSFDRYCASSNEKILRTVNDVGGLYIHPPLETNGGHYHRGDYRAWSYVRRPERLYHFVEIGEQGPGGGILRTDDASPNPVNSRVDQPTARYALTWIGLQEIQESNQGIFGEQTLIYDRQTHEILASRTFYYRIQGPPGHRTSLQPCAGVALPETQSDTGELDSYEFVSRVLRPAPINDAETVVSYDLARGMGRRESLCAHKITFGPGIAQRDVLAERRFSELHLSLSGSADLLVCKNFFPWILKDGGTLRFADGSEGPYSSYASLPDAGMAEMDAAESRYRSAQDARARSGTSRFGRPVAPATDKPKAKIYRWVDESGTVHYSDERETPAEFRN